MKKIFLLLLSLFSFISTYSQYCTTASSSLLITPTATVQYTPSYTTGVRAVRFNATAGCTYTFTTCGQSTMDTYLRLYSTSTGGTLLAQSDDFCGTQSQITWTATVSGTYSVLLTRFSCTTINSSTRIGYSVSCTAPYNPCTTIPTISNCGVSSTANMSGTGAGWNVSSCGFSTPGQERLFQFTAPTTGTYQLNVSAISGGYVDFFWKVASGGCNATGWNCIDDISLTGTYNAITAMSFTAGTTYYILLDPEGSGTYSATFSLVCPVPPTYNPCTSIPTISACGVSSTANMSGSGAGWSPGNCGFTTPGQERIFQFTPTTSGVHQLNVSAISGGYIDFFWKASSGGCTNSGWNCIDDIVSTGTYSATTPMNFIAGTTYYILLDPEGIGTYSTTFNIVCPPSGCINTDALGNVSAPTTNTPITIESCQFQSEFSTISNIVIGSTYQFGYSLGGWITIRSGTFNGAILASGNAPLNWTATLSGTVYVHYNTNSSCGQDFFCGVSTITCTTCTSPPPSNDLVCSATPITCGGSVNGTTISATNSGTGEGLTCGTIQSQPGVWYVVAGNGQTMTASLCGTTWDSKISVFSGVNCSSLTCIGGIDDNGPSCTTSSASYSWASTSGLNYYILVHGFSSNNAFTLDLTCVTPPPANPTSISTTSSFICAGSGNSVTLTANGTVGTVYWFNGSCGTTGQIGTGNSIVVTPTTTTTYYARNFNSGQFSTGCVNTTIEVRNPPTVIAGSNVTICEGNTTQLGATTSQSNTLTVLNGGTNGCTGGNMFDITVGTTPLTITSFDITPDANGAQTVNVYYKTGTYVGSETNIAAWTLLGSYPITGTADVLVNMPITNLPLSVSTTYGIYINYNSAYTTGSASISNSHMTVTAGAGLCGQFSGVNTPRTFNGNINYDITPTLSWTPSATLSSSTIPNPIASPTSTTTYTLTGIAGGCQSSSNVTVSVNSLSTSPSISFVPGTICPNTNTTLSASGGIDGTGSSIRWYSSTNGGGTLLGTGSSITIPFAETSTVFVRREGTCNNSPDSSRTVNIRSYRAISVNSATTPNYCVDNNGWGHWYDSNDEIIFSAKGDFSMCNTGYPNVTINKNNTFYNQTQQPTSVCLSNQSPGEMRFEMGRNWNVDLNGATPNGLYSVRFYHLPNEKTDVINAAIDTMNNLTNCGYSYKYNVTNNGWFWFKNSTGTYTSPQWEGTQYDGIIGATINNVTYVEMDSIPSFSGGAGGVILIPNSILPIEWKYFIGENIGTTNKLKWASETETATSHYELERSYDGYNFETITLIVAAGNSLNETNYGYDDLYPFDGINYYRLKLVNLDGSIEYSDVIALETKIQFKSKLYPNPFTNTLTYSYFTNKVEEIEIEIINILGQVVFRKEGINNNVINLDLKDLNNGSYTIKIKHLNSKIQINEIIIKK